jgi:DNA-binding LacI/PurR family transcriptional regulator
VATSVTVKDVAREANVSISTVSRVFNNHKNVTEEVRLRVLKAASHLGYFGRNGQDIDSPDGNRHSNRALREIGFLYYFNVGITTLAMNPFWSHILHGVESEARKSSIKVTYRAIHELCQTPEMLLSAIYEMKLGGILLLGDADPATIRLIQSTKLPFVLINNYIPGLSIDAVLANNFEGARAAVDYLINEGHHHIAFIGGPILDGPRPINKFYSIERRATGYRTSLLDAGLSVNYALYEAGNLDIDGGYEACKRLIERNVEFSAVFCCNDATAIGAMKALREKGYRIPEDVSVVGFDDIDMVEHLTPALTTVHINKEAMGQTAVKQLIWRSTDVDAACVISLVEVELIKRNSVLSHPTY